MTTANQYDWGGSSITESDWNFINCVLERYRVGSVLEFGCGLSTLLFSANGCDVLALETKKEHLSYLVNQSPELIKNVSLWNCEYMDIGRCFDLSFVDGPAAYTPDIGSRETSIRMASKHSDIIIVHDYNRIPELKWQELYLKPRFNIEASAGGCRLWVRKKDADGPIDIHAHVSSAKGIYHPERNDRFPNSDELIETMNANGIDRAVVMSMVSPECQYCFVTTEEVLETCGRYPDRLIPFMGIDPRMVKNGEDGNFSDILEHYKESGCRGIGEYTPNIPINHPLNLNLFKQIEGVGLPVLLHMAPQIGGIYGCYDDFMLPRLEMVLDKFYNLKIIGHSTVFWSEMSADLVEENRYGTPTGKVIPGRIPSLMRKYTNLYGDLSAMSGYNAISRDREYGCKFMEEFSDRLFFGNDIAKPFQRLPLAGYLNRLVEDGDLSVSTHSKIMWRNAERLLGL